MTRYELWYSEEDGYTFFPEDNHAARELLSRDARLLWQIDASSWEEAQSRKHEFLGWEPYVPMSDNDGTSS